MLDLIFIVDDSDTMLSVMASVLENEYRVLTLPSAKKMYAVLEKKSPNMILLDIEMPEMTGFEAIVTLKDNPAWKNIPIVFLTGLSNDAIQAKAIQLGALGVISKSLKPDAIKASVNEFMKLSLTTETPPL